MVSRAALGFAALFVSLALPLALTAQEQPAGEEASPASPATPPKAAPAKPAPPRRPASAPT